MVYLYIIHSPGADRFYVGITSQPEQRLWEHNFSPRESSTSPYRPWLMAALFECSSDHGEALKLEKFIKQQKSKRFIQKLINAEKLNGALAQLVRVPNHSVLGINQRVVPKTQ